MLVVAAKVMKLSRSTWAIIRRIYDVVHTTVWVLVAVWVAIIIINIPRLPEARAIVERQRAQQISEENRFYCEKWGLRANTHEHVICTMDLNDIRAQVDRRLAEDGSF
jgi:hypothetical protein